MEILSEHDLYDLLSALSAGTEETLGDVDRYGFHLERFTGPVTAQELHRSAVDLVLDTEPADLEDVASDLSGGAILRIDGQGFRTVDTFDTAEGLASAWSEALDDLEARDLEARAELEREVASAVDSEMPERWTLLHHSWSGCSATPRSFESLAEAEVAFGRALEILAEEGYTVTDRPSESTVGAEAIVRTVEVEDPEEAVMVSDHAGLFQITWNGPAREAELERRLDRLDFL